MYSFCWIKLKNSVKTLFAMNFLPVFVCSIIFVISVSESARVNCDFECPEGVVNPVCGSNDEIYFNECLLRVEACWRNDSSDQRLKKTEWKNCAKNCSLVCGREEVEEVCGSDGEIYRSSCWLVLSSCQRSEPLSKVSMSVCNREETEQKGRCDRCDFHCEDLPRSRIDQEMNYSFCVLAESNCNKHCSCEYTCPGGKTEKVGDKIVYLNYCELIKHECRTRLENRVKKEVE